MKLSDESYTVTTMRPSWLSLCDKVMDKCLYTVQIRLKKKKKNLHAALLKQGAVSQHLCGRTVIQDVVI